ncbi:uncharacterized protein LOC125582179 [Brassica napus]|uniref:uncharacterized protein LOC125582179 n=1 Tax=Brassica napus TaxID=3708 RepID=UPI002078889C|nr:uncharacterized protein LOC125582179 [Brassica napus]
MVFLSLAVVLLDVNGPLSLCLSPRIESGLDSVSRWLSTAATELSAVGRFESRDTVSLSSSEVPKNGGKPRAERKKRRTWTPTYDIVLISSWLNTSKDSVVGNEQKSIAFWERVATYFSCSPKLAGCERREGSTCKQRWHKLNDLVCKFCGAYEAATREKSSGMNENDLKMKAARKGESVGMVHILQAMQVNENDAAVDDEGTNRSLGVKAAKARGKRPVVEGKELSDFQSMWSLKKADLQLKERLSRMRMLESLVAKQAPLADYEEALKKKLIAELIPS